MTRPADTIPDRAWFRANREANYRVRDPLPGEVDELSCMILPAGAAWDGGFVAPEGQRVLVVVMKTPRRKPQDEPHFARFLGSAPCNAAGELSGPHPGFSLVPIALGARVALA